MIFCPGCGSANAATWSYCRACGQELPPLPGPLLASIEDYARALPATAGAGTIDPYGPAPPVVEGTVVTMSAHAVAPGRVRRG